MKQEIPRPSAELVFSLILSFLLVGVESDKTELNPVPAGNLGSMLCESKG